MGSAGGGSGDTSSPRRPGGSTGGQKTRKRGQNRPKAAKMERPRVRLSGRSRPRLTAGSQSQSRNRGDPEPATCAECQPASHRAGPRARGRESVRSVPKPARFEAYACRRRTTGDRCRSASERARWRMSPGGGRCSTWNIGPRPPSSAGTTGRPAVPSDGGGSNRKQVLPISRPAGIGSGAADGDPSPNRKQWCRIHAGHETEAAPPISTHSAPRPSGGPKAVSGASSRPPGGTSTARGTSSTSAPPRYRRACRKGRAAR